MVNAGLERCMVMVVGVRDGVARKLLQPLTSGAAVTRRLRVGNPARAGPRLKPVLDQEFRIFVFIGDNRAAAIAIQRYAGREFVLFQNWQSLRASCAFRSRGAVR